MNANEISAIHAELSHITRILYIIGALTFAAVALACFRAYWLVRCHVEKLDTFPSESEALFQKEQFDKLREVSAAMIRDRPNYAAGYWHLGRALYAQGNYPAAIEQFEAARRLEPAWEATHIDPYIREARRRMASSPSNTP